MRELLIGCLIGGLLLNFPACRSMEPIVSTKEIAEKSSREMASSPSQLPPEPADRTIKPGETLIITVWEHPELSRERIVSPEGFIKLPLFGELKVSGLTTEKLEKMLTEELTPYIKNPIIWVERKTVERKTQKITILGAVAHPGNYEFCRTEEVRLLSLLGVAGGYTESADLENISIFRIDRTDPSGKISRQEIQINLKKILSGSMNPDIILQDNDLVLVPQAKMDSWNIGMQKITPTLQVMALIVSILWAGHQLRRD